MCDICDRFEMEREGLCDGFDLAAWRFPASCADSRQEVIRTLKCIKDTDTMPRSSTRPLATNSHGPLLSHGLSLISRPAADLAPDQPLRSNPDALLPTICRGATETCMIFKYISPYSIYIDAQATPLRAHAARTKRKDSGCGGGGQV